MSVCALSWGGPDKWDFCSLPRGHEGGCESAGVPKSPNLKYFHEQPECAAQIAKQFADEEKKIAKKETARRPQ